MPPSTSTTRRRSLLQRIRKPLFFVRKERPRSPVSVTSFLPEEASLLENLKINHIDLNEHTPRSHGSDAEKVLDKENNESLEGSCKAESRQEEDVKPNEHEVADSIRNEHDSTSSKHVGIEKDGPFTTDSDSCEPQVQSTESVDPLESVNESEQERTEWAEPRMEDAVIVEDELHETSTKTEEKVVSTRAKSVCSVSLNAREAVQVSDDVTIIGGTYKGCCGRVAKITAKKVRVDIQGKGSKMVNKENVRKSQKSANDIAKETTPAAAKALTDNDKNSPQDGADLSVGVYVSIVGGKYVGQAGTIIKITPKMVKVATTEGTERMVHKKSVRKNGGGSSESHISSTMDAAEVARIDTAETETSTEVAAHHIESNGTDKQQPHTDTQGDQEHVAITGGKYNGKSGRLVRTTAKTVWVLIPELGEKSVRRKNTSLAGDETATAQGGRSADTSLGDEFRLPDKGVKAMRFGSRVVTKIRLALPGTKSDEHNFLSQFLGKRVLVSEIGLNSREMEVPFDQQVEKNGIHYELVSAKVESDGDSNQGKFCAPKRVRLVYAQVSGPEQDTLSVKEELLCLADFASLSTRKVMARLELLQSPAYKFGKKPAMFSLKAQDFTMLPVAQNDGCGFISEELLLNLCGNNAAARRTLALQSRIIVPKLGIFKGMLMRKRIPPGEPPIQLCPSMKKIGPSQFAANDERAFLSITQTGVHPNTTNWHVGRLLDPNLNPPPKSFKIKPMSDMILRLWQALGVPKNVCEKYSKNCTRHSNLKHAFVVGVADPTNSIPPGHVFVTGMRALEKEELFVTRSPCIRPSDGLVLPHLCTKPDEMSVEDWQWLNELPFGAIIFPDTPKGMKPLAELINGDLDGDLYFVCWNDEIFQHISADPIEYTQKADDSSEAATPHRDELWFEKAQQLMIDSAKFQEMGSLIGKLFTLSEKAADANPEQFMNDPDALAYAEGYTQALDLGKHGGHVSLPLHLHENLPVTLRKYLVPA